MGLGSFVDAGIQIESQARANEQNQRLAEQQMAYNWAMYQDQKAFAVDMWNKQNEYNSPKEQMNRFGEAGLNPHLIYGKGSPGNAASVGNPTPGNYTRAEVKSTAQGIQAFAQHAALRKLNADKDNVQKHTELLEKEKILKDIAQMRQALDLRRAAFQFDMDKATKDAVIGKAFSDLNLTREQVNKLSIENDFANESYRDRLALVKSSLDKFQAEINNLKANTLYTGARTAGERANTLHTRAKTTLTKKQIQSQKYQNALHKLKANWAEAGLTEKDNFLLKQSINKLNMLPPEEKARILDIKKREAWQGFYNKYPRQTKSQRNKYYK